MSTAEKTTRLEKMGLLNRIVDYKELTGTAVRRMAYCTSYVCEGRSSRSSGTAKRVSGKPDLCPDCGHALKWKLEKVGVD